MTGKQKRWRNRIVAALILFVLAYAAAELAPLSSWLGSQTAALWAEFALFLVPYLVAGYDVLLRAARNIGRGQVFDENFLMSIATIGAFALVLFPDSDPHMAEGAAVMLFYQVGELFQSYAVGKSRKSIADMMDIAPEFANVERNGVIEQVDPFEVSVGEIIVVRPGERVPLDGVVASGRSQLDTAALTGESVPREVGAGDELISGCVNLTGLITACVTKPYEQSTVTRILELVENAAEKKARTESFITRFARYYTPIVVCVALLLAVIPPFLGAGPWSDWVQRGLIFLVVSCPCALVISVPLSFFGGIGGASRAGILIKGSSYLETLAHVETVAFDKTGTLTDGSFDVVAVRPARNGESAEKASELLCLAARAEAHSNHPIALSIRRAYAESASDGVFAASTDGEHDSQRNQHGQSPCSQAASQNMDDVQEHGGHGIRARIDGRSILVGNEKLMELHGIACHDCESTGTVVHVAADGEYLGHIVIADTVKPDACAAIEALHAVGVKNTIMLTGDRNDVAAAVAKQVGVDEYCANLLPQDKVAEVERLLGETNEKGKLAFVGDGVNDAPVLARADIGIAMGAMGSDAAIEAADVVLMDDKPSNIARAVRIARKTMAIVWQNIVFALGVKLLVLALAAIGLANMWLAVFADVGVAMIAILNAMRAMSVGR